MTHPPASPDELDAAAGRIEAWMQRQLDENPAVAAVERDPTEVRRWFVRLLGEEKDVFSVWFTLEQRTLRYETYVMPAPEANAGELYEHLLRRNERLVGAHFSIGVEDAVFLRGELTVSGLTATELDRAIGTLYATVEQCFPTLVRIGFPRAFRPQA